VKFVWIASTTECCIFVTLRTGKFIGSILVLDFCSLRFLKIIGRLFTNQARAQCAVHKQPKAVQKPIRSQVCSSVVAVGAQVVNGLAIAVFR
jgi:hypothetical protein